MSRADEAYDEAWGPGRDAPDPGRTAEADEAWLLAELERERRRTEGAAA